MEQISNVADYKKVLSENKTVVLLITSETCQPCGKMKEIVNELVHELQDVKFVRMDGPSNKEWCIKSGIRNVPTTIITHDNTPLTLSGLQEKTVLKNQILKMMEK